jgi:hypothetical protein
MDFHLAVAAAGFRQAADDLEWRHAGTRRTLASLRIAIAAAYQGLRDGWTTEIPAHLLPGCLRETLPGDRGRDTWT